MYYNNITTFVVNNKQIFNAFLLISGIIGKKYLEIFYYITQAPNKKWLNSNKAQNIPVTTSFFKKNNSTLTTILNCRISSNKHQVSNRRRTFGYQR